MIGVGAKLNDRFTLEKELGQGGMGTVYRATDRVLGRSVAIKLLKEWGTEEVIRQIHLEAQILARFVHDRIVRLYDFGESEGTYFLVMEEVDGPSFANRWQDLPLGDRLRVCGEVAEALHYAHLQGVVHRDVKPGNVLLTSVDAAKLSDFGLSLVTTDRKTHSGTIKGTPLYMSPEQAKGDPLDHRTDLYSLGVMLYECATGNVPFVGHPVSVMGKHIEARPKAPRLRKPELSSTLDNLILSLLEKSPTSRPASAGEVALSLAEEAERVRLLERIHSGHDRPDPKDPVDTPSTRTFTPGDPALGRTPENGSVPEKMPAVSVDGPSAPLRPSGPTAPLPSPGGDPTKSARPGHATERGSFDHPVAREMLEWMLATPVVISPEERYLCGHYLAYLLGGPGRRGLFLRRPFDARNSDRARLMLAMTWLMSVDPTQDAIERASVLLEDRPDVRAALSPVVLVKYLAGRDTPAKRNRFRQIRKRLKEASPYARKAMLDGNGVLNPGMMPTSLADLAKIAPSLGRLDAHRASLWNRVAEVWRRDEEFRRAVFRYAGRSTTVDSVGADLWPEVVYPLIERTHWQRTFRPRHEAIWDYIVGKLLHFPVPGVRLDRMMVIAIPIEVAEQFDEDLVAFVDDPTLDDEDGPAGGRGAEAARPFYVGGTIPRDEPTADDDAPRVKVMVPLAPPQPFLFTQNGLRSLWEGAMEARANGAPPGLHLQPIPVGPYRLAVVPTARGRSAVRAIFQGLHQGKEIEIITPVLARGVTSKTVIAIYLYQDGSAAVAHVDFQSKERYILWHAPVAHQFNFVYAAELRRSLAIASLEVPDQLDRVLTK